MQIFIIVSLKRRYNRLFLCYNDDGDYMKSEEIIEEVEKSKVKWSKVLLGSLLVVISLVGIFFIATFIRWKTEIAKKYEIIYTGQEEVKVDKLVDFYAIEMDTELKEGEAILMYCTSEYGKECIAPDLTNELENNFRHPLLVVAMVVFIDLLLVYIITKDDLGGKKRTYVYGALIMLWGLVFIGVQVFKVADYYKLVKDDNTVVGTRVYQLRSDSKNSYVPIYHYDEDQVYVPRDYNLKGTYGEKEENIYLSKKNKNKMTVKRDIKGYIFPAVVGFLTFVLGIVYLTINKRFRKKEHKDNK